MDVALKFLSVVTLKTMPTTDPQARMNSKMFHPSEKKCRGPIAITLIQNSRKNSVVKISLVISATLSRISGYLYHVMARSKAFKMIENLMIKSKFSLCVTLNKKALKGSFDS
jgi:hypothetical protein